MSIAYEKQNKTLDQTRYCASVSLDVLHEIFAGTGAHSLMTRPESPNIRFCRPGTPLPDGVVSAIKEAASSFPATLEIHLPMIGVDDEQPEHAIVIVTKNGKDYALVAKAISDAIDRLLPSDHLRTIFPATVDALPAGLLEADSLLFKRDSKPWWRFWAR